MYASDWRGDRVRAGAGTLLEQSIHDLDILEHALGPIRSVSGRSANFHGLDGIEDSVATVFDLAGGGVGVHTSIWHDVLERPSLRRVEVFCERRHVVLENDWIGPVTWATTGAEEGRLEGEEAEGGPEEAAAPSALWTATRRRRSRRRGTPPSPAPCTG